MDCKVIDNFLPKEELKYLQDLFVFNPQFPLYFSKNITHDDLDLGDWSWYAVHILYYKDFPNSEYLKKVYDIFVPKFSETIGFKSLIRIKVNMYPHTDTLRENAKHYDYQFSHNAAVFSLNTCDGFTRMHDGTQVQSVENRLVVFDGSLPHNSSTTTNKARFNINFNWV